MNTQELLSPSHSNRNLGHTGRVPTEVHSQVLQTLTSCRVRVPRTSDISSSTQTTRTKRTFQLVYHSRVVYTLRSFKKKKKERDRIPRLYGHLRRTQECTSMVVQKKGCDRTPRSFIPDGELTITGTPSEE